VIVRDADKTGGEDGGAFVTWAAPLATPTVIDCDHRPVIVLIWNEDVDRFEQLGLGTHEELRDEMVASFDNLVPVSEKMFLQECSHCADRIPAAE
jgi:hypothetical protein